MRIGRYVVYNIGKDPVFIQKGETLGQCSLIYQDTLGDWVKDAFKLSDNETLRDKPELMARLIKVLSNHVPAFEGGLHHTQEAGQVGAGRTHWVTARVELRDDNQGPAHVKQ